MELINQQTPQLEITNTEKYYLDVTRKWANFFAILGFITVGLLIIAAIFMGAFLPFLGQTGPFSKLPSLIFPLFYVAFSILYLFPSLYLYRFSSAMKNALLATDQHSFSSSLLNLSKCFRFIGILTIIILCLYPLMFIVMAFTMRQTTMIPSF